MPINGQRTSSTPRSNPQAKGGTSKTKHGATFNLGPNINVNSTRTTSAGGSQGGAQGSGQGGRSQFMLPDPDFRSAAELRNYCNTLRAFAVHASIEVYVAAEILQAALSQANGMPQDNVIQHKLRARKVARKLKKAGESLADAASNAAATYAAFQREYADIMSARTPHRPAQSRPFQY
ncbi:plasmid transfer protein TraA [Streptomyces sp. NBC_01565]|uniref:plasmid transfer protein TraA n=1 Tax=Streptomyces sp. NBC_01565 TaxID=2975881 RepID=UPI00224D6F04|nr:plasmid transfer protein TraA [Streptomyces sp. NBC_01565]MCX4541446.1 plasmid transfer protein TraA [Streptomyces sp. NBC_01565]